MKSVAILFVGLVVLGCAGVVQAQDSSMPTAPYPSAPPPPAWDSVEQTPPVVRTPRRAPTPRRQVVEATGGDVFWVDAEYLMWWIRDGHPPPLVAAGAGRSRGVIGQPGTEVIYGDNIENGTFCGGRFTLGWWLEEDNTVGVELPFFFLGERSVHFAEGSFGKPLLTRPIINALTGFEDAEQVANLVRPGLFPLTGQVAVTSRSRLWGLDPELVLACEPGHGMPVELLAGFRYLSLDEALLITEDLRVPLSSRQGPGDRFQLADDFATRNDFYGGQVGARVNWVYGRRSLELLGKVALGDMHQSVVVKGDTVITEARGGPEAFAGALLAQPTNIGNYHRDRFAVVPEVAVKWGWQATDCLRLTLGYTFLYVSSVVRPGEQIDRFVNPTQLAPGTLTGTLRPGFDFHGTDFWAHGLSFGLELTY